MAALAFANDNDREPAINDRVMVCGDYNGVAENITGVLSQIAWSGGCVVMLDEPLNCRECGIIDRVFTDMGRLEIIG